MWVIGDRITTCSSTLTDASQPLRLSSAPGYGNQTDRIHLGLTSTRQWRPTTADWAVVAAIMTLSNKMAKFSLSKSWISCLKSLHSDSLESLPQLHVDISCDCCKWLCALPAPRCLYTGVDVLGVGPGPGARYRSRGEGGGGWWG